MQLLDPSQEEHLGEGELRELNESLGRLEVRVDEGFSKMRQGFSDLLDLLCCFLLFLLLLRFFCYLLLSSIAFILVVCW